MGTRCCDGDPPGRSRESAEEEDDEEEEDEEAWVAACRLEILRRKENANRQPPSLPNRIHPTCPSAIRPFAQATTINSL